MEKAEVQPQFISIWVGFFGKTYLLLFLFKYQLAVRLKVKEVFK